MKLTLKTGPFNPLCHNLPCLCLTPSLILTQRQASSTQPHPSTQLMGNQLQANSFFLNTCFCSFNLSDRGSTTGSSAPTPKPVIPANPSPVVPQVAATPPAPATAAPVQQLQQQATPTPQMTQQSLHGQQQQPYSPYAQQQYQQPTQQQQQQAQQQYYQQYPVRYESINRH